MWNVAFPLIVLFIMENLMQFFVWKIIFEINVYYVDKWATAKNLYIGN